LFAAAHAAADDLCGRLEPSRNGSSREVLYGGEGPHAYKADREGAVVSFAQETKIIR